MAYFTFSECPFAGDFDISRRLPVTVLTRKYVQLDWLGFPFLIELDERTVSSRVGDDLQRVLECLVRLIRLALLDEHFEKVIAVRIDLHHSAQHDPFHPRLPTVRNDADGLEHMMDFPGPNHGSTISGSAKPNGLFAAEAAVRNVQVLAVFGIERRADRKNVVIRSSGTYTRPYGLSLRPPSCS